MINELKVINSLNESSVNDEILDIMLQVGYNEKLAQLIAKFCKKHKITKKLIDNNGGYNNAEEFFKREINNYNNLCWLELLLWSISLPASSDDMWGWNANKFIKKFQSAKIGEPVGTEADGEVVIKISDTEVVAPFFKEVNFYELVESKFDWFSFLDNGHTYNFSIYAKYRKKFIEPKLDKMSLPA